MKNRLLVASLIAIAALASVRAPAQTPVIDTNNQPTTLSITNVSPLGPVGSLLNMLPAWNPNLTNTFNSGDIVIGVTPLWKTMTAAGSTPYLSTFGEYYFTKNIGTTAELVTLGDGAGNSSIDSLSAALLLRKDVGNIAVQGLLGGAWDCHRGKPGADLGLGVMYRYTTGIEVFSDARYRIEGRQSELNGWLARVGLTIALH